MTNEFSKCRRCGATIPAGGSAECPACLLDVGLAEPGEAEGTVAGGGGEGPMVRYVGDYELLGEIARGGMGVVYRARQVSLRRMVALKMIGAGALASREAVARFHTEAAAAARLEHPNIVPIHEIGEHEGRHYFSMKLVEGGSLAELLRLGPFAPRRAAFFLARVARAVAHAHERGVLHRDLKPANILCDERGEPHVTDFGLAQVAGEPGGVTATRAILGSPAYMSPEQAAGHPAGATTASDVYGLGAVFYELLTGRPPFEGPTAVAVLGRVLGEEPIPPRSQDPGIDRDLEIIALKCLEKEPGRRYRSAVELAEDLERWLAGIPIRARPVGRVERVTKWAARRPAVAALVVALVGMLGCGVGGIAWQWRKARAAAELAEQSARDARSAAAPVLAATRVVGPVSPGPWTFLARGPRLVIGPRHSGESNGLAAWEFDSGAKRHEFPGLEGTVLRAALSPSGERLATLSAASVSFWRPRERTGDSLHEMHGGRVFGEGGRGVETVEVWETRTGRRSGVVPLGPGRGAVQVLALSPDGTRLASGHRDGQVHLWEVESGTHVRALTAHATAVQWVEFSRDGSRLVSCPAGWVEAGPGTAVRHDPVVARVHGVDDGRVLAVLKNRVGWWRSLGSEARAGQVRARFNRAGDRLAVLAAHRENAGLWEIADGERLAGPEAGGAEILAVAFSEDDRRVAFGGADGTVSVRDGRTGRAHRVLRGHRLGVGWVTFDAESGLLLTGADDFDFRVWEVESGLCLSVLRGHEGRRPNAVFAGAGGVVSTTADGTLRHWAAVSPEESAPRLSGHRRRITGLQFTPDGRRLVSTSQDASARVWEVEGARRVHEIRGGPEVSPAVAEAVAGVWRDLAVHPGGGWFVVNSEESAARLVPGFLPWGSAAPQPYRPVRFWEVESGAFVRSLDVGPRGAGVVVLGPDGGKVAVLEGDLERTAWVTRSGKRRRTEYHPPADRAAPKFRIFDTASGALLAQLEGLSYRFLDRAAFAPDGRRFVVAHPDELRVYDLGRTAAEAGSAGTNELRPERVVAGVGEGGEYRGLRFGREDGLVAVRRGNESVEVFETADWRRVGRFGFPGDEVVMSWVHGEPGREEILTWTAAAALVRHDPATGREVARIGGFRTEYAHYAMSGDGRVFGTAQNERQVVALEVETGRVLGRFDGHLARLSALAVSADGRWVASGDEEGLIRLWGLER